jgi:hypothetical protein
MNVADKLPFAPNTFQWSIQAVMLFVDLQHGNTSPDADRHVVMVDKYPPKR